MAEAQPRSLLQAVPKSLFAIQQGVFQKAAPSLSDFCFQSEERDSAYGFASCRDCFQLLFCFRSSSEKYNSLGPST
jgi:hypothetical protein